MQALGQLEAELFAGLVTLSLQRSGQRFAARLKGLKQPAEFGPVLFIRDRLLTGSHALADLAEYAAWMLDRRRQGLRATANLKEIQ